MFSAPLPEKNVQFVRLGLSRLYRFAVIFFLSEILSVVMSVVSPMFLDTSYGIDR